jgi:hypothetical protein
MDTNEFDAFQVASTAKEAGEDIYDFQDFGQDPLEWLIDAEPSILPESSLPIFPDLSSSGGDDNNFGDGHVVEDYSSHSSTDATEPSDIVSDDILNSIADPNVTVQSLFLLPDDVE